MKMRPGALLGRVLPLAVAGVLAAGCGEYGDGRPPAAGARTSR
jgi:hypothetical protein